MPPKKAPSSLASQKSLLSTPAAAPLGISRTPLPAPLLPASDSLPPLWCPSSRPRELFPEWPTPAILAAENWGTPDALFEDPLPLSEMFIPHEQASRPVSWKRPSQFMPPIVEPVYHAPALPIAAPVPEPKAPPAKKGATAPAAKKPVVESEPAKRAPPPPKHAHVFFTDSRHDVAPDHVGDHKRGPAGAAVDTHPSHTNSPAAATTVATVHHHTPGGSAPHTASPPPLTAESQHRIPRDFRRVWSADELEELAKWHADEVRIANERQQRERVYMVFEDAIAYIVNDRPRGFALEEDVDADDLIDDGQDDDDGGDGDATTARAGAGGSDAASNDSSPWGVLPPPRIDIAPNAIAKPECPHGDVVHGAMASLFRIVEQLYDAWSGVNSSDAVPPFLWRAIYPQDAAGIPVYNPSGKYSVKLFVLGKWRRVDVDDRLPVDDDGNIVYVTSSLRSEIWPGLLTKALLKVLHWLHGTSDNGGDAAVLETTQTIRIVNTVISALTGWKTSRWEPRRQLETTNEAMLQQLLEFVPVVHSPDESSETIADTGEQLEDAVDDVGDASRSDTQPLVLRPRVIVCSTLAHDTAVLCAGEAALVTDIVGDSESTTLKLTSLRGALGIPEERIDADRLVFLLIHPPCKHSDLLVQQWSAAKNEHANDDASHAPLLLWSPFANLATQFAHIAMPHAQATGDVSSEAQPHAAAAVAEVVLTLTRIAPVDAAAHTQDVRLRSAREMAQYVPAMDPLGSVVLIEELHARASSQYGHYDTSATPLVVTLNTSTSTRVVLPHSPDGRDVVFRVEPQSSLCYGYGLQIESNLRVTFQDASTYWRNTCDVQVVNSDGTYPVLLPYTWNVLFKHNVELAPLPPSSGATAALDAAGLEHPHALELYVDLHVSDAMLMPYVHVSIVDDDTGETTTLSTLCSVVSLPVAPAAAALPRAFTFVVDCAPHGFHVPEGKWHLTLGSNWLFRVSASHAMKLTAFEASYEANKPLLLFRDVIVAPKSPLWTSYELQLFASDGSPNTTGDDALADALAIKLEVIDAASEQVLSESWAMRSVRMLQLPRRPQSSGAELDDAAKSGLYILQGVIDRARCVVPDALCSVRPFRNRVGSSELKESAVSESATKSSSSGGGSDESDAAEATGTLPSARQPTGVKWRLNCWSAEDVNLDVDRTKENRYDAIRASWAEAAKDRFAVTNGAVSRLLFLKKPDAADAKIHHDGVSEELAKRIKARFEWITAATSSDIVAGDGAYLECRHRVRTGADASASERMRTPEDFVDDERALSESLEAVQNRVAQQREDRAASKEQRVAEVKDLVQSIREQRSAALRKRAKLWQERDALLHPPQSAA